MTTEMFPELPATERCLVCNRRLLPCDNSGITMYYCILHGQIPDNTTLKSHNFLVEYYLSNLLIR